MAKKYNNPSYPGDPAWIENLRKIHPFKLFIYVAIVGIGVMFLFFIFSFIFTNDPKTYFLPKYFALSTIAILASSLTMLETKALYKSDNLKKLNRTMAFSFILGLIFIFFQMLGWKEMFTQGLYFNGKANASFLFLLSGLHLLHYFAGLIFFLVVYLKVFKAYRDKVQGLIYVTDPFEYMKLDLLNIYWHFMDFLWVSLYLIFVIQAL